MKFGCVVARQLDAGSARDLLAIGQSLQEASGESRERVSLNSGRLDAALREYRRDEAPTGATRLGENPQRGVEAYDRRNTERTYQVIEAVRKVAAGRGVSPAVVALAWLVDRPAVTSVIIGARTIEQLDDNLDADGVHLTAEEYALLDEASTPLVADYPYGEPGVNQRARTV